MDSMTGEWADSGEKVSSNETNFQVGTSGQVSGNWLSQQKALEHTYYKWTRFLTTTLE